MSGAKGVEQETIEAAGGLISDDSKTIIMGLLGLLVTILSAGVKRVFTRTDNHERRIVKIEKRNAGADQTLKNMEGHLASLSTHQSTMAGDVKELLKASGETKIPPEIIALLKENVGKK